MYVLLKSQFMAHLHLKKGFLNIPFIMGLFYCHETVNDNEKIIFKKNVLICQLSGNIRQVRKYVTFVIL